MPTRIYGAGNIARHCNQQLKARDYAERASTSQADQPHERTREQERNRKRRERQEAKQK